MAIFPSSGLVPPPVNVCQNRNDSIRSCDYLCHFSFLHRWPEESMLFAWANPELTVYDLFKLGHSYKLAWFSSFPDFFPPRKYVIYLTANWVITLQKTKLDELFITKTQASHALIIVNLSQYSLRTNLNFKPIID